MTEWDPFRVRNIPKTMDGFQAITFLLSNECDAPAGLYIETLKPFVGTAIIRLLEFGALDIVRGYFRPVGTRGGRHYRRGNRKKRLRGGIPEIGSAIGRRLPYAKELAGRHVSDGVRNLWMFDSVLQGQLNNLLIADIIDDSLVGWAQMLKMKACNNVGHTTIIAEAHNAIVLGISGWHAQAQMVQIWPSPGTHVGSIHQFGQAGGFMTFGGSAVPSSGAPTEWLCRVAKSGGGHNYSGKGVPGAEEHGLLAANTANAFNALAGQCLSVGGATEWELAMTLQIYVR